MLHMVAHENFNKGESHVKYLSNKKKEKESVFLYQSIYSFQLRDRNVFLWHAATSEKAFHLYGKKLFVVDQGVPKCKL